MGIVLYNTLTRATEPLEPIEPPRVRVFVCGPTVYDRAHLGHAKTYTQFDLAVRHMRHRGLEVSYLQNITDSGRGEVAENMRPFYLEYLREHGVTAP